MLIVVYGIIYSYFEQDSDLCLYVGRATSSKSHQHALERRDKEHHHNWIQPTPFDWFLRHSNTTPRLVCLDKLEDIHPNDARLDEAETKRVNELKPLWNTRKRMGERAKLFIEVQEQLGLKMSGDLKARRQRYDNGVWTPRDNKS